MKIAIATRNYTSVVSHAGQARQLLYELAQQAADQPLPTPQRIELQPDEVLHTFADDRPHPLDGVDLIVAGSAGDGFVRHMKKRGADVLLTGESDPAVAIARILAGEALPEQRFDITMTLCKLRDLFSRH